eukprot:gene17406-biopygen6343
MATNDCSALSDSDSESSDSSAADIGDFSSEFIDEFYNVFGDSDDEEEEFEGFRFEMPEVKWALGGNVRRQSADAETVDERPKPAECAPCFIPEEPGNLYMRDNEVKSQVVSHRTLYTSA